MIEALSYGFMQKALLGGIMIAIACGLISPFLVMRRMSLLGDGLAHFAFGGVAIGVFFGFSPLISALIAVVVGSLIVQRLIVKNVYSDAAIALILSLGVGMGIILIGLARGFSVDLFSYLIGSVLALSSTDLILIASMLVVCVGFVVSTYKHLLFSTFSEDLADVYDPKHMLINTLFSVVVGLVVVLSIRAVGILLISAMLVLPALIALRLGSSFRRTVILSVVCSVIGLLVGILSSFYLDVPPSGMIVMTLFALFLVAQTKGL